MEETFDYLPESMLDPGGPLLWIRHLVAGDGYHELTAAPSFDTAAPQILLETTAYQVTPSFSPEDERAYRVVRDGLLAQRPLGRAVDRGRLTSTPASP